MKHPFLEWLVNLSVAGVAGAFGGWLVAWANTYEYRKHTRARVQELRDQYQREQNLRIDNLQMQAIRRGEHDTDSE